VLFLPALLFLFADAEPEPVDLALKRFVEAYAIVEQNAADPINPAQAIYEGAIPGMLRRLDPHSVFFDPGQFEQLKDLEKSTRKGFGSVVSILPGRVIVLQTLPGTPSAKSGMIPGDEIIAINGIRLDRLEIEQLIQLLQASRQNQVSLHVRRPGSARLLQLMLTPEDVESPSVDRAFEVVPGIGYIRISSFDVQTGSAVKEAVDKLGGDKLKGLIIDLRNNPGGVLTSALDTAALFLKPGQKVLSVRGRSVQGTEAAVPETATPYGMPLAILINEKSASASEIVAGAFEDHGRATLIGVPSFGKGLVQSVFPLSQGTGIALTTAFYYTPRGRSIQRKLTGQLEHTTAGAHGGITPAHIVYPEAMTPLRGVLEATGTFPTFATGFLQRNSPITPDWEVSNQLLDDLQVFLSQRNIRPGLGDWSKEREWIRNRLRQEIFNQALGVEKGDEVEAKRDPMMIRAVEVLSGH
jgi:carboxyl-terminal processing protease